MIDNKTIIMKYNVDEFGNPISLRIDNEKKQVSPTNNVVQLEQTPDELHRVVVLNEDETQMTEVYNQDEVGLNTFFVDYNRAVVYFHPNQSSKKKIFNYYGKGMELISCERIFDAHDKQGNWVVRTLQDLIDRGRECLELIELLGDAVEVILSLRNDIKIGQELHNTLTNDIEVATPLQQKLHADIVEATKWKDQLHTDVQEGKVLQPLLEQTIADGNTAKQQLEQTIANAQDDINKIEATGNEIVYITSSEWVYNDISKMYEKQIAHPCNSENLHVTCKTADTKEALFLPWKIVDKSNILLKSDEPISSSVIISARYYKPLIDNTTTQEVIDARKGEVDLKTKINKIDERLNKITYIIDDVNNIQNIINSATDKVRFVKKDYIVTENIQLKGGIEYDGCGATLYLKNSSIEIENSVSDIIFKNFNIIGDLKYTKILELYGGGTQIKCEKNVFNVGDFLGCSNYGKADKPYAKITSYNNDIYELDTSISSTGELLDNEWGAIIGNFQWSALINGKHNTNNITIENCIFENARGYSLALPNSDNIILKNTTFKNNGLDFCVFSAENRDRHNLLIENCKFENSIDFGKQGIVITKKPNIYYNNIKVKNCVFNNISESGISFGYAEGNLKNVIIEGCEFENNILFAIHICGNAITLKDNIIKGSLGAIRLADIETVTYGVDSLYSDINIYNNNISNCKNGVILTQVNKAGGGKHNPKNIDIVNNKITVECSAIEVCGTNINVDGNRTFSNDNNGSPFYASSIFVNGESNKNINILNNFFDGEVNVLWRNTFNMLIKNNNLNSLLGDKAIRIKPTDNINKDTKVLVCDNTIYKTNNINLSCNDGNSKVEFKNNKGINGDLIVKIPYMKGKSARYEFDGDGNHWLSNTDNSWIVTKDNYFESDGKYAYIANDGTLKVTEDISMIE